MEQDIAGKLQRQREYFAGGATLDVDFRRAHLRRLREVIRENTVAICNALHADLHKSDYESYMTEIGIVLAELGKHIRNLRRWARPRRVASPVFLFPSRSRVTFQPYGLVLIVAPWNYPFQLLLDPLIGAVSAGNVAALKSSPAAPATSRVVKRLVGEVFDERYVSFFEGHRKVNELLFAQRFDRIFLTGSPALGKVTMEAAARNLTPVTLELGGKSPCIVTAGADLAVAAKRIAWGKLLNAGQTCVAPDYLLVDARVKDELIRRIETAVTEMYGADPAQSPDYPRIVDGKAFDRITRLMASGGRVVFGGGSDRLRLYIAPTIIEGVTENSPIMKEEIFGPVLPVMEFGDVGEAVAYVNRHEKPLALYVFGDRETARMVLSRTSSGGACVNDTILHLSNDNLPFGGVGHSGTGRYHGYYSFLEFSHQRAVLESSTAVDLRMKYPPYKGLWLLKRFM